MYETRIRILYVTLGKQKKRRCQVKQTHGFRREVKRRVEMDSEMMNGMFDETDDRRNEKDVLGPVISSESWIVTLAPPIPFTSPKVKPRHRRCHRPQS
jgi:hypothetical protein